MHAFTKGDGKETSPRAHLNSDLVEFKSKSKIEKIFKKINAIPDEDQYILEKITTNGDQLNSNFLGSSWLTEDQ